MKTISCIICPNSCSIMIDENTLETTGNKCPRGKEFAKQELINPVRTVTSTIKTTFSSMPVLSCKTSSAISKSKIKEVMNAINQVTIDHEVHIGDVLIPNVANTNVDIIATSNLKKE